MGRRQGGAVLKLAIHRLLAQGATPEAIDRFLKDHSFPLAEGNSVTFVYRGEADRVELRHFIYGLESARDFQRVAETDLWYQIQSIPECSRVEYKIDVIRGDQHHWIRDPLNPYLAHDPFGANSVCHGAGYQVPAWTEPQEDARKGSLEEHRVKSQVFDEIRPFKVYLPARYRPQRSYPLLVVHDGDDYLRYSRLQVVLDNLIHRLEIPPLIVALTNSADRLREYGADEHHARYLVKELVPALEALYPLIQDPASRGLMGASFGGVATFHTAWKYPGFFGRLLLQSGSFAFTDIGQQKRGPAFEPVVRFINAYRERPEAVASQIFITCGVYESLIYENRSLVPILQETGMKVRYVEARDGHNWENWRDRLRTALSSLFPGPLWMVYE
jgi:enterochelin esterase family protein